MGSTTNNDTPPSYFTITSDGKTDRLSRWENSWNSRYERKPGFHRSDVHPALTMFATQSPSSSLLHTFSPPLNEPMLVPLCGKTLDLSWLASSSTSADGEGGGGGYRVVVGVEGVSRAISELKEESLTSLRRLENEDIGNTDMEIWTTAKVDEGWFALPDPSNSVNSESMGTISILRADFFELPSQIFSKNGKGEGNPLFGGVYDRASMVAIPPASRINYVAKIDELLRPGGEILLVTIHREDDEGPPFCVTPDDVEQLYGPLGYDIHKVGEFPTEVKGMDSVEYVFILKKPQQICKN